MYSDPPPPYSYRSSRTTQRTQTSPPNQALCQKLKQTLKHSPPPPDFDKWQHELFGDFSNDLHAGLETALTSKYDLRPAAREASKLVTITWIDQDESGTYDPDGKRSPSPLSNPRKRWERYEHADDGAPKRPKTSTWQMGRFRGSQMIVTFRMTTVHGIAWQRS